MKRYRSGRLARTAVGVGLLVAPTATAASLQRVEQSEWWGSVSGLPSYVNMYLYVPDQTANEPPIVVAPHHCQGTGPGTFSEMSSLVSLANQNGFILIFPEATGQNCWDAGSARSLTHDGGGDTHAVVHMVRYTLGRYNGNQARVYSVGGSSGGIMTEALLGVYPDVFTAGVSYMGVPSGCWAVGYNDVVGKPANGTGQWSGPCAGGNVEKSGPEWGDLVRSFLPGYTGHRPRLQHWHGTADTVLNYANLAEDIKQWTNVLGLSEAPTGIDMPTNGTTHQYWASACGYTVYETFSLAGVGHAVPFDGRAVAAYFGLDAAEGPDPEAAACPAPVPADTAPDGPGGATDPGEASPTPSGSTPTSGASDSVDTLGPVAPVTDRTSGDHDPSTASAGSMNEAGATSAAPGAGGPAGSGDLGTMPGRSSTAGMSTSTAGCTLGLVATTLDPRSVTAPLLVVALAWLNRRGRRARSA